MFELSDPDRGLLEQTYVLCFSLKFGYILVNADKEIDFLWV